jgi:hypothetical protein
MSEFISRRAWVGAILKTAAGVAVLDAVLPGVVRAAEVPVTLDVYKDPSCGCCAKWVDHLVANGYKPKVHDRSDMDAFKDSLSVPKALRSCHTAVLGPYWIEGHVPAADMKKLMSVHSAGVVGLAAPGMPAGSPGMEMGKTKDRFDVIAAHVNGQTSVFATHG